MEERWYKPLTKIEHPQENHEQNDYAVHHKLQEEQTYLPGIFEPEIIRKKLYINQSDNNPSLLSRAVARFHDFLVKTFASLFVNFESYVPSFWRGIPETWNIWNKLWVTGYL